jgi:hypothetical protein
VRATWPADVDRAVDVGVDPTGEAEDPSHPAIRWMVFPAVHGLFVECDAGPVRPRKDALGLWLRARAKGSPGFPFRADFDGFTLERVATGAPRPGGTPR